MIEGSENLRERNGHSAILYKERFMIVFGGIYEVVKELDDVSVLDLRHGFWHEF